MLSDVDPNEWSISDPQPGIKGGKTCLISQNNRPITINLGLGAPLSTPFGAHSFDDSTQTRVNLDLTIPPEIAKTFEGLDAWLVNWGLANRDKLFRKKTDAQIQEQYRKLVRKNDEYPPLLRTKIDLAKVRVWDALHAPTTVAEDRSKHAALFPKLVVRSLWVVNATWGVPTPLARYFLFPNRMR